MQELWTVHLGRVPYEEAVALQERVRGARLAGAIPDTLLVLEHPPVYTRGRRTEPGELPLGDAFYAEQGITIADVPRGGKVTFHGPGQLVAYPVVGVEDVREYVARLEDAMVGALADHGIAARGRSAEGHDVTGVWVGERKIGSIGVHLSHGVSIHGLAVNVDNDLTPFGWIVPCGLGGVAMTSITQELGPGPHLPCFRKRQAHHLAQVLGARQRLVPAARLERALAAVPA